LNESAFVGREDLIAFCFDPSLIMKIYLLKQNIPQGKIGREFDQLHMMQKYTLGDKIAWNS